MVVEKAAPVDSFVAMESEAALKQINMVAGSIMSADRVLKGADLLTPDVKAITTSLAAGKVPDPWDDKWEGPDSPAMWLQVLWTCHMGHLLQCRTQNLQDIQPGGETRRA